MVRDKGQQQTCSMSILHHSTHGKFLRASD